MIPFLKHAHTNAPFFPTSHAKSKMDRFLSAAVENVGNAVSKSVKKPKIIKSAPFFGTRYQNFWWELIGKWLGANFFEIQQRCAKLPNFQHANARDLDLVFMFGFWTWIWAHNHQTWHIGILSDFRARSVSLHSSFPVLYGIHQSPCLQYARCKRCVLLFIYSGAQGFWTLKLHFDISQVTDTKQKLSLEEKWYFNWHKSA